MKGDDGIVRRLNDLLTYELTAADQYLFRARVLHDQGLGRLAERFQHEHADEQHHARRLADRILFLEGTPDFATRHGLDTSVEVAAMLRHDLAMEHQVVAGLRDAIALCENRGDYVSRDLLRGLLTDTEEDHVWWLETQLHLIEDLGLANYLQSVTGGPHEG
mgnify:CR=1 FL=1